MSIGVFGHVTEDDHEVHGTFFRDYKFNPSILKEGLNNPVNVVDGLYYVQLDKEIKADFLQGCKLSIVTLFSANTEINSNSNEANCS